MLIKAMIPQFWDVSRPDRGRDGDGVSVTRVAKPQAVWVYRGQWTDDGLRDIPEEIREIAESWWTL